VTARALLVATLVALAALPARPHAHAAKSSYGDYVKAARAIEEWRYEEARGLVDTLKKQSPDDPETRYLMAQLAFLQGDYAGAHKLLEKLDAPAVRPLVRDLAPLVTSTQEATAGMQSRTSKGGHFEIFFHPGKDELLVDLAGEVLEAAYAAITVDLGYAPPGKVRVEILERVSDLAKVSPLTERAIETSGTIALCKYNKLMIVSPRATLTGYAWMDTLAHEFTHYLITRATHDKVPIWLHEGLAKYEESRWRAEAGATGMGRINEHLLSLALKKGRLITFEEMHPSMALLPSQEAAATAFAEVYAFVAFLHTRVGYAGVRAVLERIRDGRTERRAIAEVLGVSWEDAQATWKKYLKGLPLRLSPALAARGGAKKIRLKKSDGDDENVGVDAIAEDKAKKHARLGGLLRARGRLGAAASEYEKAIAVTGPNDVFLASKLARTYLELGSPEKAITVIEAIPDRDDEDAGPETTLGAAYLETKDMAKAEMHLLAALRVQPFDPAVRCGLAEVYTASGRDAEAEREKNACRVARSGPGAEHGHSK
jgi:tetratricopeptide (TPR) repeat protein